MRLFTAIDLPEEIRDRLGSLIAKLRPRARLAWSPPSNLHITTKFIGPWPDDRLPQLQAALAGLRSRAPIPIHIAGLGLYPNPKSPRVFFAAVEPAGGLEQLAADLNQSLAKLDIPPEKRAYSPHLTLARIKTPAGLASFRQEVERQGRPEFGDFLADRFFLYLSKTGPAGSVYTKLSEFPFST